jgi:hypothetical protein
MIKNTPIEALRSHAVEILSKTFLELRQHNIVEDDIVSLSLILAEDLQRDFKNLEIVDIKEAFRKGIRETDDFLIGPKIWYKWIKKYRNLLWDAEYQVRTQGKDPKLVPLYKHQQKLLT